MSTSGLSALMEDLRLGWEPQPVLSGSLSSVARPLLSAGYKILEHLGSGSAGAVFKARELSRNRIVAVKVLRRSHPIIRKYFEREGALGEQLDHRNIVRVLEYGVV